MNKISNAIRKIKKIGISGLFKNLWVTILIRSRLKSFLITKLGRVTLEKIAQFPCIGYWPNIENPQSFNEHISHRKLFTDEDLFIQVSDKYAVRDYVREKAGEEILNSIYYVTTDPYTIPFESLPNQFVIKPTHSSGQIILVDDKNKLDYNSIRSQCANWLEMDYGQKHDEYWYSNIEPKVIIEQQLTNSENETPIDYKVFVFHGEAKYIQVICNRFSKTSEMFYDTDWNPMEFTRSYTQGKPIDEPDDLSRIIEVAEILGEDFEFARVDLYQISDKIVFGEITLAPGAGYLGFNPKKWDFKLGQLW